MYHIELRQFPHNLCRFNLTEQELRSAIIEPWAGEQWIELGERKWSPHQARLTVLEGPSLPVDQLSMGRGWRNAQRQSQDVTQRMLDAARHTSQDQAGSVSPASERLLADSLGLELLANLAAEPVSLRHAWQLADTRHPERSPGESLSIAERAVRSLLHSQLVILLTETESGAREPVAQEQIDSVLYLTDSWINQTLPVLIGKA
jgi:hypothetical protein